MKAEINLINHSALQYNRSSLERIKDICAPLRPWGITCFNYSRNFRDGTHLYLSDRQKWIELYIANNIQDDVEHFKYYFPQSNIHYALWAGFKRDKAFDILYEYNMWNGFTIYEHSKDFTEIYDFGSTRENTKIINFYLRNKGLLRNFVQEFKEKMIPYIDFTDKSKMITPSIDLSAHLIKNASFVEESKIENFFQQIKGMKTE